MRFILQDYLIIASLFFTACSSSDMSGEARGVKKDANAIGKPGTPGAVPLPSDVPGPTLSPGPTTSPTPTPTPTPTPPPGTGIPGLANNSGGGILTFPSFYIGMEDRASDPDPAPYGDFSMCFRGLFGERAADKHIVALEDQTVSFDLRKSSGCGGYTFTLNAISPDGTKNQTVTRSMSGGNAITNITVPLVKGTVIEASVHIDSRGGGCDVGSTRVLYQAWTAVVHKTAPDCSK